MSKQQIKDPSKFKRRKKRPGPFTIDQINVLDPHDVEKLTRFISDRGKILPRRLTGTSLKYQRKVSTAVKRARHLALLPYVGDLLK